MSYPFHTTGQLLIDEMKEKLQEMAEGDASTSLELQQQSLTELIRQAEQAIFEGLQRFPGDQFLLALESDLGKVLDDHARAVEALKRAFEASRGKVSWR